MTTNSDQNKLIENQLMGRDKTVSNPAKRKAVPSDSSSSSRKKPVFVTPSDKTKAPEYNESFVFESQIGRPALLNENRVYTVTPVSTLPRNVVNIDAPTAKNGSYDPTYAFFLFKNKQRLENKNIVGNRIILGRYQHDIPKKSYLILCNFLSEVAMDNALQPCTFVSCLHLLDRVLALKTLKLQEVQLVGCACLLIASKLEDIYPPTADGLVYSSGNSFDKAALFRTEVEILKLLDFKVYSPTRYDFATRFSLAGALTKKEQCLVHYLVEISFQDYDYFNKHSPSKVAAAAVHLALQMTRSPYELLWTQSLRYYTGFEEADLTDMVMMLALLRWEIEQSKMKHSTTKFSVDEQHNVAGITAIEMHNLRFDSREAQAIALARLTRNTSAGTVSSTSTEGIAVPLSG